MKIKKEESRKIIINSIIDSFLMTKRFKNKDTYDKIYDFIVNSGNKNLNIFINLTENIIQHLEMINLLFKKEDKILHEDDKYIVFLTNDAFLTFFSSSLLKISDLFSVRDYILYYHNYLKSLFILPMIGYKLILSYDKINNQYIARCDLISLENDNLLLILDYNLKEQNNNTIPIISKIIQNLNFNDYMPLEYFFIKYKNKIYYLNKFLEIDNKRINTEFYISKIKSIYINRNLNYDFNKIIYEILTFSSALYVFKNTQYDYKNARHKRIAFEYLTKKIEKNNIKDDIIINGIKFSFLIKNHPIEYYNILMKLCFNEMDIKEDKCAILCYDCKKEIEKIITKNIMPQFNDDFSSIIDELYLKIRGYK